MGKRQDHGKDRMFLKPSPNEEFKLLQDEKQKLRKLRLQQVREQEKALANQVRKKFKEKEKQELNLLGNELKRKWQDNITEKRTALENLYLENVSHVGEGHHAAFMCEDDGAPKVLSLEDETKVAERYKEAVKKVKADEAERTQLQYEKTEAKQKALEIERIRAARVAALEPPVPDIAQSLELIQKHRHKPKNIDQYSSTYYHLPPELVERADPNDNQIDARDAAKEEAERIQDAKEDADRNFTEQMEKARLRHKHARSKLLLQKDHDKLLEELEHFERIDRQRRQDIVSKIPKHVFEPPHRRMEANEERQRDIEHAFEDMYMAQTNHMGDVTAVQEPLVTSPAMTDDALDTTTEKEDETVLPPKSRNVKSDEVKDDVISMAEEERLKEETELAGHGKKKVLEEAEKIRSEVQPSSKDPLRRLLKKIDLQRDRWRSKKTVKELGEHDNEVAISDEGSGFSEGTLTISTVNTQSVESDVAAKPKETLLHPYEEAERTREAAKKSEVRGREHPNSTDVEKQKQLLQQQKLKLQLQQQQVLQEHLQLQFDMLQNEIETTAKDNETDTESSATKPRDSPEEDREDMKDLVADKDTRLSSALDSLSSGLLSEDGKTISVSDSLDNEEINTAGSKEDAMFASLSNTSDSRVIASLGRREVLSSIPESIFEDDFAALTPVHSRPDLGILSQPMPIHIEMPIGLHTGAKFQTDKFGTRSPSFQIAPPPTTIPVAAPQASFEEQPKIVNGVEGGPVYPTSRLSSLHSHAENAFPGVTVPPYPQIPVSPTISPFNFPSSAATTFPSPRSQPLNAFQLPDNAGTDTASYLKFYQEQLADQQERIREQQRAIQTRQQQRLEQLKQFQERLRVQRIDSAARLSEDHHGFKDMTDPSAHWRSLVPTSRAGHEGSSTGDETQSDTESRSTDLKRFSEMQPSIVEKKTVGHTVPKTLSETRVSDGDETTSSSLNRYPSDIVPPHRFDDRMLFPDPSELGLWSDSTVRLSSSDATKSSSGATFEESRRHTKNGNKPSSASMAYQVEGSSTSLSSNNKSSSDPNRSSESASVKSRKSIDSGPLSISSRPKSDKSLSSSASDSNNNLLLRMESSFQHFQEMIEEAKTLNEKYLSPSKQLEESLKELSSLKTVADTEESINDDVDDLKKGVTNSSHEHPSENGVYEESLIDNDYFSYQENQDDDHNFDEVKTFEQNREELYSLLNDPSRSTESEHTVENILHRESEMEQRNVRTEDVEGVDSSQRRPLINRDGENFIPATEQYPVGRNLMEDERQSFELPDVSDRALSIIPEETVNSDDDLSEGVIEDDEHHFAELNTSEPSPEDFYKSSRTKDNTESSSFRGAVYKSPNVSNNSFGTSPSVPHSVLGIHRTGERQSFEPSSDNSGNRYPSDSHRLENPSQSELMTTSDECELHTISPTTAKKSADFSHSVSDVVISGFSDLSLSQPDGSSTGTSGLSLQEAFHKNRPRFFKDSEQRVLRTKEARFRQFKPPVVEKSKQKTGEYNGGINPEINKDKNSQVLSDLKSEDVVGEIPSDGRQKIGKQDMMARTKRLYDNLPDVRKKQDEKRREETYTGNRAKAHQFQQETRQRLRKLNAKKTGRKQS